VTTQGTPLVEVQNLKMHFPITAGFPIPRQVGAVKAVDGISFAIAPSETLGLVGESGCGKTTVGRTLLRLYQATDGKMIYQGRDVTRIHEKEFLPYRRKMQMIFQDPYASLDPRMTCGDIIGEAMDIHGLASGKARMDRIYSLLDMVGLLSEHASRFPHEFSGGQRQRIGIARALAVEPDFIVCDEPISALDVSIQAQVVNLLEDLQKQLGVAYLFIAHDLSMVKHISHRIAVMYLGRIVESATSEDLYARPMHPYTLALLSAVPIPDPKVEGTRQRIILEGDPPSPVNPPSGCRFRTRCPYAQERCKEEDPKPLDMGGGHLVACHFPVGA
jgi:oligopeptide transport system ATP-binding protein